MAFFQRPRGDAQKALLAQMVRGSYVLLYLSPERWGIHKLAEGYNTGQWDSYVAVGPETFVSYVEPGLQDIRHKTSNSSHEYEIDAELVVAVFQTHTQAIECAQRMVYLMRKYREEMKGPLLGFEMGLDILLSGGR